MTKAVLYFGGNAENVVFNASEFEQAFPRHSIYLVNYRGYSGSTGNPHEAGLYADAEMIFDKLAGTHQSIDVVGRSLGTGIATYLAAIKDVNKLALITPYDSIRSVAQRTYWMFPVKWLLKDRYDSLARVPSIKSQTLIIIAEKDNVIPYVHSKRLIDAFPTEQVLVKEIANSDHNSLSVYSEFYQALSQFINE